MPGILPINFKLGQFKSNFKNNQIKWIIVRGKLTILFVCKTRTTHTHYLSLYISTFQFSGQAL